MSPGGGYAVDAYPKCYQYPRFARTWYSKPLGSSSPLPFNVQAPLPPHFVYGTGISTYMDHFGRKKAPTKKRMVTPPRMTTKPEPKDRIAVPGIDPGVPSKRAIKEAVHDYVNKLSSNNRAVYDAMAPVFISNPYREPGRASEAMALPPQWPPAASGRSAIMTPRSSAARNEIIEGQLSVAAASTVKWKRSTTAPPPPSTPPSRPAAPVPDMTAGERVVVSASSATKKRSTNAHWICWDTGELEPPGLQTRLTRPWPTPPPPPPPPPPPMQRAATAGARPPSRSGGGSGGYRAGRSAYQATGNLATGASGKFYTRRLYANYPVPDDIAMSDMHDTMLRSERAFLADPENIDRDVRAPYYVPNPLPWYTEDGYDEEEENILLEDLRHAEFMAGDAWRSSQSRTGASMADYARAEADAAASHATSAGKCKRTLRESAHQYEIKQQQARRGVIGGHRLPHLYGQQSSYEVEQQRQRSSAQASQYSRHHFNDGVNYGSPFTSAYFSSGRCDSQQARSSLLS